MRGCSICSETAEQGLGEVLHSHPIPAEIAWTDAIPAIVAQRSIRPRSLRVPHCSRFRREVLRSRDYRAVSGFVVGFVRPRHRHRVVQGDQRYQDKDGEFHGFDHSTGEARHFHKSGLPERRCSQALTGSRGVVQGAQVLRRGARQKPGGVRSHSLDG